MSTRAQASASPAAALVALIGLILIIYILTLPPQARDELLAGSGGFGEAGVSGGGFGGQGYGPVLILAESPGTLQISSAPAIEHSLPSTTVFTSLNTVVLKELSSLTIKNSAFSRSGAELTFDSTTLPAQNFLLTFNVDLAQGDLQILLNGHSIFQEFVTERSPKPIILPVDYLVEGENKLTFITSGVGFMFWQKNEYRLKNVLISADAFDYSGATSEQVFAVTDQELSRMEGAALGFVPECDTRKAGRLVVELNGALLYSGYPDCGVLNRFDVSKERLRLGDNRLVFVSEEGSYLLDAIQVTSYLIETSYPVYYFNLPLDLYEPADYGDVQLLLTMRFADYRAEKRGELVINGFVQSFDVDEFVYQAVIDPDILLPGPNTLQLIPHVDRLDVAELKIEII